MLSPGHGSDTNQATCSTLGLGSLSMLSVAMTISAAVCTFVAGLVADANMTTPPTNGGCPMLAACGQ
jgi:hypothetical protein